MLRIHVSLSLALSLAFLAACGSGSTELEGQVVEAGCGLCQFQLEGRSECYWAIRIGGKEVMVRGDALPSDEEHDSHGPEGMCSMTRTAIVSGTLYETYFAATSFELQPVAPGAVPTPHQHEH